MKKIKLPQEAKHLAWLDLNSEDGQEYWIAMNLAGEYASANHHNFAWKEQLQDGTEVMVHRFKGHEKTGREYTQLKHKRSSIATCFHIFP